MMLSNTKIQEVIKSGELGVTPSPEVKECAIKIHVSDQFGKTRDRFTTAQTYTIHPKEFVLARSKETLKLSMTLAGLYDGYIGVSSQGIFTHLGSMLIDPGFEGQLLLEMYNVSDHDIVLKEGDRVGHVIFLSVE